MLKRQAFNAIKLDQQIQFDVASATGADLFLKADAERGLF